MKTQKQVRVADSDWAMIHEIARELGKDSGYLRDNNNARVGATLVFALRYTLDGVRNDKDLAKQVEGLKTQVAAILAKMGSA